MSIATMDDSWPAMVGSVWSTAGSYIARAYRVDDRGIHRVLTQHSCGVPFFGINDRDRFVVITEESPDCFHTRYATYYLTDHGPIRVPGFVKQR